jgi:signal transduction histidine kinase/PAS domain-containing protein
MTDDRDTARAVRRHESAFLAGGVALGLIVLVLSPVRPYVIAEMLLAAVAASAWYGGLGVGLLAAAVAATSAYVLVGPFASFRFGGAGVAELGVFVLTAALVSALRRTARTFAERAAASTRAVEQKQRESTFLAEASRVLSASLDYETTLGSVARLAVPFLADLCVVDVLQDDGRIRRLALEHVDPAIRDLLRELDARYPLGPDDVHPVPQVIRSGAPIVISDVPESLLESVARDAEHLAALCRIGSRSGMVIPLVARGRVLGAVSFAVTAPRPRYEQADVMLAEDLAARCATAIDNARLYRTAQDDVARRRLAEERLALAFEAAHIGTCDWNVETGEVQVQWADALDADNLERRSLAGSVRELIAWVHPEDRGRLREEIARAVRELSEFEFEMRVLWPDGSLRWISVKGRVVCDTQGKPVRVIGVPMDVTERKRTEQRLAVQYETTRILADCSTLEEAAPRILRALGECLGWVHGGVWRVDAETGVLRSVRTWAAPGVDVTEFATTSREMLFEKGVGLPGRAWETGEPLWIPDVVTDANFPRAELAGRGGLHGAIGFPIRSGPEILGVLEFFSPSILAPDTELLEMIATIGTQVGQFMQRRRAEAEREMAHVEARAAERRAAFVAEASRVLSSSLDSPATLDALARLTVPTLADWCTIDVVSEEGVVERIAVAHRDPAREDLLRSMLDRYPPPAHDAFADTIAAGRSALLTEVGRAMLREIARGPEHLALIERLEIRSFVLVPLVAHGRVLGSIALASATPGRFGSTELALAEDLGRRAALALDNARLYRAAQDETRRKDEFLAMLGHELRNPLAAIDAAMRVLARIGDAHEPAVRQRAIVERQLRHLVRLVDDLLDVSRVVTGKVSLQRELVDLNEVAARCLQLLRPRIDERQQRATLTPDGDPVVVRGDPVRLEQVVLNLLDNAIKYTPRDGRIDVTLEHVGDEAVLRVRDTGMGISENLVPRVFDMFAQASRSLDRSQGGLGLGLTLVRRLIEQHGGSVAVTSAGPERGSEFVVSLPLVGDARPAPSAQREASPPADGPPRHVLLVEDNADGREALRTLLELGGHRVDVAEDGPSGIAIAQQVRPDVALIDIGLPGLDGYQVAAAIRAAEGDRVRLIALTGYGQSEDRRRALEAGFDAHLVKPVEPDELSRLLAGFTAARPT